MRDFSHLHPVPHHGHFVKSGLTIEDDNIIVACLTLNNVSRLENDISVVLEVDALIVENDEDNSAT